MASVTKKPKLDSNGSAVEIMAGVYDGSLYAFSGRCNFWSLFTHVLVLFRAAVVNYLAFF